MCLVRIAWTGRCTSITTLVMPSVDMGRATAGAPWRGSPSCGLGCRGHDILCHGGTEGDRQGHCRRIVNAESSVSESGLIDDHGRPHAVLGFAFPKGRQDELRYPMLPEVGASFGTFHAWARRDMARIRRRGSPCIHSPPSRKSVMPISLMPSRVNDSPLRSISTTVLGLLSLMALSGASSLASVSSS